MPYTMLARNQMLTHLDTLVSHLGLLDADPGLTGLTSDGTTFTKTAHGYANGNLIVLSALTGGSALVVGRPYFVITSAANTFQVAHVPAGTAVAHGSNVTAGTSTRLVELSGGTYARVAITYAAPADGVMDDSTNGVDINVPAGATVDYVGYYSALTAGDLHAITAQTPEGPYGSAGIYRVTDSKLNLNATGAA